jgi:hypothetical protein
MFLLNDNVSTEQDTLRLIMLSRMRDLRSGLDDWTYWHFDYNYNHLQQLPINGCLRLAPFLTGRVPSLPLWRMTNEESLATEISYECQITTHDSFTNELSWTWLTFRRTEYRSPSPTVHVLLCFIRCHGNVCLASRWLAMDMFIAAGTCVTEPLPSNGHIRHYIYWESMTRRWRGQDLS